ncbi:MAG TPA: DUF3696 domain-containing protein [Burkholderiales bacterium]|nr:DUF3696 domain-containing protein [Burkholderiales bacterium]
MIVNVNCGNPEKLLYVSPTTFHFPERYILHPMLQVKWIEDLLGDIYSHKKFNSGFFQENMICITTNSDHIINRLRVARKDKEIENLNFHFIPFDDNKSSVIIKTDRNGTLSEYPKNFLDEWSNQISQLIL